MKRELRDQSKILSFRFNEMKTIRWFKQETKSEMFDSATFESSAFLMLILLWILASPLSIWAMIFSISCSSLQRSQNTAGGTSTHEFTNQSKRLGLPVRYRIFFLNESLPEYSMTSSGVFPSTSLAMFSISSLPHFSLALMNWLKSRLFQIVNPCNRITVDQHMHNIDPD